MHITQRLLACRIRKVIAFHFAQISVLLQNANPLRSLTIDQVNAAIRAYEQEKARLEAESNKPGVRGLTARHTLAQLAASPLAERLNMALIKAEATVRQATKKFSVSGGGGVSGELPKPVKPTNGLVWWMNRDLQAKKKLYGRRASKFN